MTLCTLWLLPTPPLYPAVHGTVRLYSSRTIGEYRFCWMYICISSFWVCISQLLGERMERWGGGRRTDESLNHIIGDIFCHRITLFPSLTIDFLCLGVNKEEGGEGAVERSPYS